MPNFKDGELCCYCGIREATTRDHVPPKSIFNLPLPSNLITVPSCFECNNSTSRNDELFKIYLGMHVGKQIGAGEKLFSERVVPSIKHNRSQMSQVLKNLTPIYLSAKNKPFEKAYSMKWDSDIHDSAIEKIARGLYYHEYKEILGSEVKIHAYWFPGFPKNNLNNLNYRSVQEGAFSYHFNRAEEQPKESIWIFKFYNAHWAGAITTIDI